MTGTYDRWAEAVVEGSAGAVSLLADPVILPTLDMPQAVAPGLNPFTYSASLIQAHLQRWGHDLHADFHTVLVRARGGARPRAPPWGAAACTCAAA